MKKRSTPNSEKYYENLMISIHSGGRNYASAIWDQTLSLSAKSTILTQKLDFGEKIIICTRNCTLLTKGIVKSLKKHWFNVCFSPRGRAGGIRAHEWLFASKSQHYHQNYYFGGKVHFCAETCSGGLRGAIRSHLDAKSDFTLRHLKGGS